MPDPLATIEAVRRASREADGQDPLDEAATLRLKHHGLEGTQSWFAGTDGFALRRGDEVDLVVSPAERGHGLGAELAAQALAGSEPTTAWSHGDHPAAARLAERHGLARERELWVMRNRLMGQLPPLVEPVGVRLRHFLEGDDDELLRVNAAAFAAHPEQGGMSAADLRERMAEPWFDPEGLLVAGDDQGTMLGFHWTKQHSPELGEVYVVGIDPAAQGRGVGRLLTLAGLHHLAQGGTTETLLYVEADNTPAVGLYEGLGFSHAAADTHVQYRR